MIRIGKVTDIDGRSVRVHFPDADIVSGWLKVVSSAPNVEGDAAVTPWMPSIGDNVLCVFGEGFNPDGYVIGGL